MSKESEKELKQEYRNSISKVLGEYFPNDNVFNVLTDFMFTEAAKVLDPTYSDDSIDSTHVVNAFKSMVAFAAKNLIIDSVNKACEELGCSYQLESRNNARTADTTPVHNSMQKNNNSIPIKSGWDFSEDSKTFDFDISAIPKASDILAENHIIRPSVSPIPPRTQVMPTQEQTAPKKQEPVAFNIIDTMSNEFVVDDPDFMSRFKNQPKDIENFPFIVCQPAPDPVPDIYESYGDIRTNGADTGDEIDLTDYTLDASDYSDDSYNSTPSVSMDLDY